MRKQLAYSDDFQAFWSAYPRKRMKRDAWRAWGQTEDIRPALDVVLTKIGTLSRARDWLRDAGQWIPYPATWLRADGWEDEVQGSTDPDWHGTWSRFDEEKYGDDPRWNEYTGAMMDWQATGERPGFEEWVEAP